MPDPGGTRNIDISSFGLIDALLSLVHSAVSINLYTRHHISIISSHCSQSLIS